MSQLRDSGSSEIAKAHPGVWDFAACLRLASAIRWARGTSSSPQADWTVFLAGAPGLALAEAGRRGAPDAAATADAAGFAPVPFFTAFGALAASAFCAACKAIDVRRLGLFTAFNSSFWCF